MAGVGLKYIIGLVAIVCWPFGWVIASVVTNAMLDAAATASLIPVTIPGGSSIAPVLTVLLVGLWLIVSSAVAPYVTWRVLTSGANPAAAFAQGVGGAAQGAFAAGVGAATAAVTGGASAGGVVAAAALGSMAGGTESAARGGGSPQTTATAVNGMAGFYRGQLGRRQVEAMEVMAASNKRRADAAEAFSDEFSDHVEQRRQSQSGFPSQPHDPDPNQGAIDIESHDKS
jgi:type IV secretion system protein TrbL